MNSMRLLSVLVLSVFLLACGGGSDKKKSAEPTEEPVFRLSGSITPASNSDYDSDMQPRVGSILLDNTIKSLNNPVTLGGYLSGREGFYSSGPDEEGHDFDADAQDRYVIALAANQQIRLSVFFADQDPDGDAINLRLSLRSEAAPDVVLQELTINSEETRSLTVAQSGSTILQLDALNASSPVLYTLTVSELLDGVASAQEPLSMHSDFVPGEVIVQLKSAQQGAGVSVASVAAQSRVREAFSQRHALHRLRGVARNTDVFALEEASTPMRRATLHGVEQWPERQRRKWQTLQAIEALKQDPDVLYAEPNFIRKAAAVPNDPLYNRQWSLPMLDLPAAWDLTQGQGVIVAVLDTGVATDHLDLIDNLVDGYDFVSSATSAGDGNGRDEDPFDLDPTNHGTHVAGIIAAVGDNARGMTGVAHAASIMPLRVLGADGNGSDADVAAAIYYAAGLSNSSGRLPSQRADIINLSLGSTDVSTTMQNAINAALDAGVIVVAAAGNNGADELFYPAAQERVIAVSSVTDHKTLSSFSNFGDFIDVAAPGGGDYLNDGFQGGILSTLYASEYGELMGTSMAAPHVSGVIALMLAQRDTLTLEQLRIGLDSGGLTENIGASNRFGAGLINAARALNWLGEAIEDQLNIFPTQLSFIGANDEAVLTLSNPGQGTVIANPPTASEEWLELVQISGQEDENGLGRYEVNINRGHPALPPIGSVTAFITVQYSINGGPEQEQRIDVFVSNSTAAQDHVGNLYIYLLRKEEVDEAEEGDTIQLYASVNGAYNTTTHQYDFNIVNVEPGEYYLEASTDNDGDYFVYDAGEARGAYPVRALPTTITVSDSHLTTGLDFNVAYDALAESSGSASVRRVIETGTDTKPRRVDQ